MASVASKGIISNHCSCCGNHHDPKTSKNFICSECFIMPREVPTWDQYFMGMALTASTRSKDPHTQVGAILVRDNRIIGTGYNGFAPGAPESPVMWQRPYKYDWVIHAEMNCILHAVLPPKGATLYTTMYPCKECAKLISSAGITRIVYASDKYKNSVSGDIFAASLIVVEKLN